MQGTQLSTAVYKQACDVEVGEFLWTVNEWATQNTYAVPVTENINVTAYGDVMPLTMTVRSPFLQVASARYLPASSPV